MSLYIEYQCLCYMRVYIIYVKHLYPEKTCICTEPTFAYVKHVYVHVTCQCTCEYVVYYV